MRKEGRVRERERGRERREGGWGAEREKERGWASEAGKQTPAPSLSRMERLVPPTGSGNNNNNNNNDNSLHLSIT